MHGKAGLTDVTPVRCYVIYVIGPDNSVYSTYEAFHGYPEAEGASTYVPGLKHTFGHGAQYQYACCEVHDGNERKCWIHAARSLGRNWAPVWRRGLYMTPIMQSAVVQIKLR